LLVSRKKAVSHQPEDIAFKKMFFAVRGASSRATFCLSLAREDAPRTSAKNSFS
jgi:hypothetical protein